MILGMATLALTASAAFNQGPALVNKNEVKAQVIANGQQVMKKSGVKKAAPATINDVVGVYSYDEYRMVQGATGWAGGWNTPVIELGEGANTLAVKNFWNPQATGENVLNSLNATFDPVTKSITIPTGQSVGMVRFSDGTSAEMYMYIQDWNSYVCYDEPIVFEWDEQAGGYMWIADGMAQQNPTVNVIISNIPNGIGQAIEMGNDFMVAMTLDKVIAIATTTLESEQGVQEANYYINAEFNGTTLSIRNLLTMGFSSIVNFNVDTTNKTVTAPRTLYAEDVQLNQAGTMIDDLYWEGNGSANGITGTFTTVDGISTVNFGEINIVSPQYGPALQTLSTTIPLPFDLMAGVGVEDITIDANAPVEYYNMQGMRVANPEKGQLVIARQGEKAVKMIVK